MKAENDQVATICYGVKTVWSSRKKAADFFLQGMMETEGSECERYTTIFKKLLQGFEVCSDED